MNLLDSTLWGGNFSTAEAHTSCVDSTPPIHQPSRLLIGEIADLSVFPGAGGVYLSSATSHPGNYLVVWRFRRKNSDNLYQVPLINRN